MELKDISTENLVYELKKRGFEFVDNTEGKRLKCVNPEVICYFGTPINCAGHDLHVYVGDKHDLPIDDTTFDSDTIAKHFFLDKFTNKIFKIFDGNEPTGMYLTLYGILLSPYDKRGCCRTYFGYYGNTQKTEEEMLQLMEKYNNVKEIFNKIKTEYNINDNH